MNTNHNNVTLEQYFSTNAGSITGFCEFADGKFWIPDERQEHAQRVPDDVVVTTYDNFLVPFTGMYHPGIYKRCQAGINSLFNRKGVSINAVRLGAKTGYECGSYFSDYDEVVQLIAFSSYGYDSNRHFLLQGEWGFHVSNSGYVRRLEPLEAVLLRKPEFWVSDKNATTQTPFMGDYIDHIGYEFLAYAVLSSVIRETALWDTAELNFIDPINEDWLNPEKPLLFSFK